MKFNVLGVLLTGFMLVLTQGYLTYSLALMSLASLLMVAFIIHFRYHLLSIHLTKNRFVILIIVSTMTLSLPFAIYKTTAALFHYGIGVLSIVGAYVVSRFPSEACRGVAITLYVFQAITVVFLFTTDFSVLPLDHMYKAGSSNGITSVLVVLQAVYSGLCFILYRKTAALSSLVTLYICIAGFSRGSILTSAMICFVVLVGHIVFIRSFKWRLVAILLPTILTISLLYQYSDALLSSIELETKFAQGFSDSHRDQIHRDYLGKIDLLTFFTGADFSNTTIQSEYNNNPHSSLIRAHHMFGILYVVAIIFVTLFGAFAARGKNNFLLLGLFILIIIARSLSEPILFPTPMDFFFFLLIFVGNSSSDKFHRYKL